MRSCSDVPSGVMRYSTATGRVLVTTRATDELGIPRPLPPLSAIGVDYLLEPDVLVEVEATAILD